MDATLTTLSSSAPFFRSYALTGAVFRLEFGAALAAFAVGGRGPEEGPHGPSALLYDGTSYHLR